MQANLRDDGFQSLRCTATDFDLVRLVSLIHRFSFAVMAARKTYGAKEGVIERRHRVENRISCPGHQSRKLCLCSFLFSLLCQGILYWGRGISGKYDLDVDISTCINHVLFFKSSLQSDRVEPRSE